MEKIKTAMQLLQAVHSTMDDIEIRGIDNQDKFVGCANAIQTVSQTLGKYLQEAEAMVTLSEGALARELVPKEETDGR